MAIQVTNVGWGSRLLGSIKGVGIGLLLFIGGCPLLFWNEGRAVKRAKDLEQGRDAVVDVDIANIDPAHNGSLVHLMGPATTIETLTDPELGVQAQAIRLRRTVEMYQWHESRRTRRQKRLGGGQQEVTEFTYAMEWGSTRQDSSQFNEPNRQNPPMPYEGRSVNANVVMLGSRMLTPALTEQIDVFQPLPVAPAQVPALNTLGRPVLPNGAGLYVGMNPATPQIGDLRVSWEIAPPTVVSVLAAQQGPTFSAWNAPTGRTLEQNLEVGVVTAASMFGHLESANETLTWILRFVGWLLLFIGLNMVFRPLVVVADVVPFLGSIIGGGFFLAALVISVPTAFLCIAVGWVVYRPLIGLLLLAIGLGFAFGVGHLVRKRGLRKNAERAAARA